MNFVRSGPPGRCGELDTSFPISFFLYRFERNDRGLIEISIGEERSGEDLLSGKVEADFALAPAAPRFPRCRPRHVPPPPAASRSVTRPLAAVADSVPSPVPCRVPIQRPPAAGRCHQPPP
jgi:hypothetical protein